jgi:hypothetical protein
MLPRTTGTRVVLPQPGHRTAAPAHPGEAPTTDPADAGQHPEHPPPTRASLQQRVTTSAMPRTDSTRRTMLLCLSRGSDDISVAAVLGLRSGCSDRVIAGLRTRQTSQELKCQAATED